MADGSITGLDLRRSEAQSPRTPPSNDPKLAEMTNAGHDRTADSATREPLRELIDKLERVQGGISRLDPGLGSAIRQLAGRADRPGQTEDASFRTRVAYVVQDVEKLAGPIAAVQAVLREELTRLAATSPGLRNERMQELVRITPVLDDRALIRDIRRDAVAIAAASDQGSPDVQSRIDVLENRVRLSARVLGAGSGRASQEVPGARQVAPADLESATGEAAKARTEMPTSTSGAAVRAQDRGQGASKEDVSAHPRSVVVNKTAGDQAPPQQLPPQDHVQQARGVGVTLAIMQALRKPEPDTPAPWDQQLAPLRDRMERYTKTSDANREEASLVAAERSGRAAVEALQAFANGPGAGIAARIRDAAKADPDGMQGVVAGMREGGPYADLRRTFNADLQKEHGLAAALDRAATAVGRYGAERTVVDGIAAGRADAGAVAARFEKLDAEIGKAASATPSRKESRSQMEELGERAAEIASKAVEAIKAALDKVSAPQQQPSASPSPSPT